MVNYILYRMGQFIALSVPLNIAYKIAVSFSDLHYFFAAKDRRAVGENLRIIFPDKPEREIRRIRIRVFRNFAKYLVDFFRFSKVDEEYIRKNIRVENMHYFEEALKEGKGVIVLSVHIGNWELGAALIALLGFPLWIVVLPHKEGKVDHFFNFQRESKGVKVMPVGRAARACLHLLKENKMVALLGDRDFTEKGVVLDFFGKPAFFPEGPAAFALRTGSSIVPGFMLRNSDDTFTLRIERPFKFIPGADKKQDIANAISQYKLIFEEYIRKYPDQWYMFRRFWVD